MLTFTEYMLPAHWASTLINGDESGLEDHEIELLNQWLEHVKPGWCVDVKGEPEFRTRHDADDFVLACECACFVFQGA